MVAEFLPHWDRMSSVKTHQNIFINCGRALPLHRFSTHLSLPCLLLGKICTKHEETSKKQSGDRSKEHKFHSTKFHSTSPISFPTDCVGARQHEFFVPFFHHCVSSFLCLYSLSRNSFISHHWRSTHTG